jgi:hypothetical protein
MTMNMVIESLFMIVSMIVIMISCKHQNETIIEGIILYLPDLAAMRTSN